MADNMERDKTELLSAKEKEEEEEEMKRELLDMKMYETWYTYKDMKDILGFINESKDMANIANDEKNVQKELMQSSNKCTPEIISKTNLEQEHNDTSQSTHSYRINHTSPMHERISTHGCSSPDIASASTDSRNSSYKGNNLDNEDMFVKLQDNLNPRDGYSHNRYISLKSKNSLQDSDIANNIDTKMDTHSECNQKLDRWQINPLDSCVSENDVPLQEPNRPLAQDRMPFKLYKEAQTPEMLEKLLPALNIHLKQTAELWHSWHRTTDTKFQWGSPIQVGYAKNNSDKKPLSNIKAEQNQMEYINKYNNERPNKRKSTLVYSPDTRYSSSDEDEKIFKKQKTKFHDDISKTSHSNKVVHAAKCNEKNQNSVYDRKPIKNVEAEHLKMVYKKESKECLSPESVTLYRNTMTPSNIRKNINKRKEHTITISPKSSLVPSSNEKQNVINLLSKDKDNILTDEEILIELEKDSVNKDKGTLESIEIKPLPIKNLSRRIRNECMILEKIQLEKQKKLEIEKENAQKKEAEKIKKREEFYKKQIEERQKEEKEKYKEEKNKRWSTVMDTKSRRTINKENKERLESLDNENENKTLELIEDNKLFEDDTVSVTEEMEIIENDFIHNVNCPICSKSFSSDKIEVHAAECEQYISEDEYESDSHLSKNTASSININSTEILECGVCSNYKTTNGIYYEEHVNNCLQKQHKEESLNEYSSNEIDNILNSPVRCYRPISEQTDSHINYKRQFPTNSKTQIHFNRKRKR